MTPMRLKRNSVSIWVTRALVALAALRLLGCARKPAGESEEGSAAPPAPAVLEVTVTRVGRADMTQTLAVTGTIAALPNQDVRLSSLVPGRIAGMMVAEGDHVKPGQVLAKIEDRPFLDQIQQAEAAVEQTKANLENARLNRDRNESLFRRGIAAQKDVEDARTQVSVQEAAGRQAEAVLALARLQLARTEVRSPLVGTVVKRLQSVGEQVEGTAAQPLFEVANLRQVELFGNVPAVYLGKIRVGKTLPVTTDAFSSKVFEGRVVAVSPAVDPSTNVGLVRIRISNSNGWLRLGMFLAARVPLETHAHTLVVPPQAVYRDEKGQPRVYRVQGDFAEAVPVTLGFETQDRVELLSGAQAGEIVILTGGYGLGERAQVEIKP